MLPYKDLSKITLEETEAGREDEEQEELSDGAELDDFTVKVPKRVKKLALKE